MGDSEVLDRPFHRRTAVRYKLRLPATFHWNDGVEHTSWGVTGDVASEGALILSNRCPPVGSEVRLEVVLPSPEADQGELRIGCAGKVIHAREGSGYSAFGVHGVFEDGQPTPMFDQYEES
jgi:hypothetical protein